MMHGCLHGVRHLVVQLQHRGRICSDVRVGAAGHQLDIEIVGDRAHANDALGSSLGGELGRIRN